MNSINFNNFGYIEDTLPKDLFLSLLKECEIAEKSNKEMISDLSGLGVPKHYWLKDNVQKLHDYLKPFILKYDNSFDYIKDIKMFNNNSKFYLDTPWINVQKKYEFIPNHTHDGVFSYTIWMKIPYDINEELKIGKYASTFEFIYNSIIGTSFNKIIPVNKNDIGKIIFFPSKLNHCVYPFYTSDDTRISISGNILFEVNN